MKLAGMGCSLRQPRREPHPSGLTPLSALARHFGDVSVVSLPRCWGRLVGGEALEQVVKVGVGELPLERGNDLLVVVLEGEQCCLGFGEAAEVVRGELARL